MLRVARRLLTLGRRSLVPRAALCLAAIVAWGPALGQSPEPAAIVPSSLDGFKAEAAKVLAETRIPGAGIALVRLGGVEWAGGIGLADRDTKQPVTADTHFRVGSISKTFIAAALVKLYEDGEMELDAPVKDLAPDLMIENRWDSTDPVTVRHLLQHTAGFDDMHFNEMYNLRDPPDLPLADVLKKNPASRRVRWRPGTRMFYSNPGYGVAGYVLEQVTKRPYEEVIAEKFFKPLGMKTSSFILSDSDHALLAKGYGSASGPAVPFSPIYLRPAGNLHTSPAELGVFVQLLLNWGETAEDLVIDPEYLSNMERPQTSTSARAGLIYGYGTGIASSSLAGYPVLGHAGGIDGFSSVYGYSTSRDVGYVVLLNGTYSGDALNRIASLALRYLKKDVEPPPKPEAAVDTGLLDTLAGYYHVDGSRNQVFAGIDWLRGGRTIRVNGTHLSMTPFIGTTQELVPVSASLFRRIADVTPSVYFGPDDEGRWAMMGDGLHAVRAPRWRIELVRSTILVSLAILATVPMLFIVWLIRVRHARPRGFWWLKVVLLTLPLCVLALASLVLFAPVRELGLQNGWTWTAFAGSSLLPIAALTALLLTLHAWQAGAGRWLRAYALVAAVAGILVSSFMASAGLLALRTWSY